MVFVRWFKRCCWLGILKRRFIKLSNCPLLEMGLKNGVRHRKKKPWNFAIHLGIRELLIFHNFSNLLTWRVFPVGYGCIFVRYQLRSIHERALLQCLDHWNGSIVAARCRRFVRVELELSGVVEVIRSIHCGLLRVLFVKFINVKVHRVDVDYGGSDCVVLICRRRCLLSIRGRWCCQCRYIV